MFVDYLESKIASSKSFLAAGFDPQIENFPKFLITQAQSKSNNDQDFIYNLLISFHQIAISAIKDNVACVKANIAFFEQYGLAGIKAFIEINQACKIAKLPFIADAKRGDIGSTAQSYSNAFIGEVNLPASKFKAFDVDALTYNAFLGFDTLDVVLKDSQRYGKGLFVLVKTSNPGSQDLQDLKLANNQTISQVIALKLAQLASSLSGKSGLSGLGAVVGATNPEQAQSLRQIMPTNFFLIPGYGAQGGSAKDAVAGFIKTKANYNSGGIINVSRALFSGFANDISNENMLVCEIENRLKHFNADVNQNLKTLQSTQ